MEQADLIGFAKKLSPQEKFFLVSQLTKDLSTYNISPQKKDETDLVYRNPSLRKLLRFKKEDKDFIQTLHSARRKAYQQFIDTKQL